MMTIQVLGKCRCTSKLTMARSVSRPGRPDRGDDAVAGCIELAPNQDQGTVCRVGSGASMGPRPVSNIKMTMQCKAYNESTDSCRGCALKFTSYIALRTIISALVIRMPMRCL